LDISVDILSFFKQLLPVLEKDESLFCISAWNDQVFYLNAHAPITKAYLPLSGRKNTKNVYLFHTFLKMPDFQNSTQKFLKNFVFLPHWLL